MKIKRNVTVRRIMHKTIQFLGEEKFLELVKYLLEHKTLDEHALDWYLGHAKKITIVDYRNLEPDIEECFKILDKSPLVSKELFARVAEIVKKADVPYDRKRKILKDAALEIRSMWYWKTISTVFRERLGGRRADMAAESNSANQVN